MTGTRFEHVRLGLGLVLVATMLSGCPGEGVLDVGDGGVPARGPGESCTRSEDCTTSLCLAVGAGRSVCTATCRSGADCPAGGWGCVRPAELPTMVCGCTASGAAEICGDGLDNDCNGRADDCRICDGRPVPEDDPAHCGACGRACRADQECHAGACRCSVPGEIECGGRCVDASSDMANCGACGTACAAGHVCSAGACACPATAPTDCGGTCVDTTVSRTHCGACGRACVDTETCVSGTCTCPFGQRLCDGTCVDTSTSVSDCGACGVTCRADQACVGGACECTSGEECSGTCEDTSFDEAHCGGCGLACLPGEDCYFGTCDCPSGLVCGGVCVASADPLNCGACGNACSAATLCNGFSCVCPVAGAVECGGVCVDPRTDALNCGACGVTCDPGTVCVGSRCVCPIAGQTFCPGVGCVALSTDAAHCGSCTTACAPGQTCSSSRCSCPATLPTLCAGVGCVTTATDPLHCGSCTNVCRTGEVCSSYACRCPTAGSAWCASVGDCTDTLANTAHCGACDRACPAGASCVSGSCRCPVAGETACGTLCTDMMTDEAHCGSCTRACTGSQLCLAGLCTCASPMRGSELRVSTAINDSFDVHAAWSGSSALVVWTDARLSPTQIFARRVAEDGTLLGTELQLSAATVARPADQPAVVWTGTEWGVVWQQYAGTSTYDLYLARIAPDGTVIAPATVIATTMSAGDSHVAFTAMLGYVVVRQQSTTVVFQSFGATGSTPGLPLTVVPSASIVQGDVSIAAAPSGQIAVLWWSSGLYLQLVNADGSVTMGRVAVTLPSGYSASRPSLTHDGTTWLAAWQESSNSPAPASSGVAIARGATLSSRVVVTTTPSSTATLRRWPLVTVRGAEAIVTWHARTASTDTVWRIDGRRFALPATGAPTALDAAPVTYMSTTSVYDQLHAAVATSGGLLLTWPDTRWGATEVYDQAIVLPACGP